MAGRLAAGAAAVESGEGGEGEEEQDGEGGVHVGVEDQTCWKFRRSIGDMVLGRVDHEGNVSALYICATSCSAFHHR